MQTLKPEIRSAILKTAEALFYQTGFQGTTMRTIADGVSISVSNLYKYYENKEALFDAVIGHFYRKFKTGFTGYIEQKDDSSHGIGALRILSQTLYAIIKADRYKFVILIAQSDGTPFSIFRQEIVTQLAEHIFNFSNVENRDLFVSKLLADNFFSNLVEVAREYRDDAWALKTLHTLVTFHSQGVMALH